MSKSQVLNSYAVFIRIKGKAVKKKNAVIKRVEIGNYCRYQSSNQSREGRDSKQSTEEQSEVGNRKAI